MHKMICLLVVLATNAAQAAIIVDDQVGVLSPAARQDLAATSTPHRVVASFVKVASEADLDALVGKCVTTPNTICIGVDPVHHKTRSHFGIDTGVPRSTFQQVSLAGNLDFKTGDWAGGIKSIIARADAVSLRVDRPAAVVIETTRVEAPFPKWPFYVGFGLLGLLVGFFFWRARKRERELLAARDDMRREAGEYAGKNIEADRDRDVERKFREIEESRRPARRSHPAVDWRPEPIAPQPAASQTVVVSSQSGSGDLLTGLVVGEAIGRRERTPAPEPRRHRTPTPVPSYSSDDYSSSSSSSSDDDGGGGGSDDSFDSGGGGGDFESSDGGGGGGDF